jgi:rubrerythrin
MVKLYVCKVCGEPYLGEEAPNDCPFCGSPKNYMRSFEEYAELWDTKLSEQEKKGLKETLNLEINATAYYLNVSKQSKRYSKNNRLFKQLARVEQEHANIVAKFLNIKLPEIKGEETRGSLEKDLERTKILEVEAIKKYQELFQSSQSPNLKNFYLALIHAEKGHRDISIEELESLQ